MDTIQIVTSLKRNKYTRKIFYGVYPIDKLPDHIYKKPSLIIINTAVSTHPGEHWIAVYVPLAYRKPLEVFDSYGRILNYKYLKNLIKRNTSVNKVVFNRKVIQSPFSSVCGHYCCMFCIV